MVPPSNAAYSLTSFTYNAWVNFTSFGSWTTFVEHDRTGVNWMYHGKSGNGNFLVCRANQSTGNDAVTLLSTGTTYFTACSFDASTGWAIAYLNGIADLYYSTTAPTPNASALSIGLNQSAGEGFAGTMPYSGVRAYNRQLSLSEHCAIYRSIVPDSPTKVIWDDDYAGDVDGVSAHYLLLALHTCGYINVIGMVADSSNDYSAPAMFGTNNALGFPSIPIGAYKGTATSRSSSSPYAQQLGTRFGVNGQTRSAYTSDVQFLCTLLDSQPNSSVTYVLTGFATSLAAFLQSNCAGFSSQTGAQLWAAKVTKLVYMGGDYPLSVSPEFNFAADPTAANYVFANSTVSIVGLGVSLGSAVPVIGANAASALLDPLAYALALAGTNNTAGYDPMAIHYAGVGLAGYYSVAASGGTNVVNTGTGTNAWSAGGANPVTSYLSKVYSDPNLSTIYTAMAASVTRH